MLWDIRALNASGDVAENGDSLRAEQDALKVQGERRNLCASWVGQGRLPASRLAPGSPQQVTVLEEPCILNWLTYLTWRMALGVSGSTCGKVDGQHLVIIHTVACFGWCQGPRGE